ncbi:MAG: sigma-70 family RNA polymerase sigma factor [Bacteroidaceae bacterium]|nr:sigma-70 family RNA polymerase sigma factor [Bacteroidaceae bacterium]
MERDLLISLVTRAQKGDSTAMNELFANFYNDVYYFALKTVKDSDTACDITQETFLEIINTIGNLKEPAAFVTWMKQITYHQCTRYFKKKKDVLVEEDEDGNTIFDTLADESEGSIPSEIYEKEEFRNTILGIINELTEEQRSAVMMYYFDDLAVGQIAEIQGVSEGTVKSRLNYARKAIKKSVENYEKKHNIKLHSFSLLPLLLLFFGKELMPTAKAAEIGAVVSETSSAVATGSVVGGTTAVVSVEATVATAGTGLAAKIAAMPIVTKIIAGIVAVSVAVGGGVALLSNQDDVHQWVDCVDENHDCICDVCSAGIHFTNGVRYAGKVAHDAVCDYCGTDLGFYDEDVDNICDVCGEYPCGNFHKVGHCDGDSDGICENCGANIESESTGTESSEHYDLDIPGGSDGLCDHCGVPMCVLGMPTMHWDRDNNCACDECGYVEHFHGQGDACGHCDTCNKVLGILDINGDGICDLCGEGPCGNIHPHADEDGDGNCDFCSTNSNEPVSLATPYITIDINSENAVLTINPVQGATRYRIHINGHRDYLITGTTYIITRDMLNDETEDGIHTITIFAENEYVSSDISNAVTVGKLANPEYHATGTGVDLPWGDTENAQGYIIYDENGDYLATMELGGSYDFSDLYTEDGFYFPYIQAYADGWISSEKCGIPVSIGSNGGPIGN